METLFRIFVFVSCVMISSFVAGRIIYDTLLDTRITALVIVFLLVEIYGKLLGFIDND